MRDPKREAELIIEAMEIVSTRYTPLFMKMELIRFTIKNSSDILRIAGGVDKLVELYSSMAVLPKEEATMILLQYRQSLLEDPDSEPLVEEIETRLNILASNPEMLERVKTSLLDIQKMMKH